MDTFLRVDVVVMVHSLTEPSPLARSTTIIIGQVCWEGLDCQTNRKRNGELLFECFIFYLCVGIKLILISKDL